MMNEHDLQLVIQNKTLGSLKTNATHIKELIIKSLPNYDVSNYNDDNIDQAKADKALLNNSAKALNSKRLELEKEFIAPFNEFKVIVNETITLINECSGKIDNVVKDNENAFKEKKKAHIVEMFNSKGFELVPLDKIFNKKWLNKGSKDKDIEKEIDDNISKIKSDIETLNVLEDADLLKSMYLDNLDLNRTIQYADTLKKNREKVSTPISAPPVNSPFIQDVENKGLQPETVSQPEKTEMYTRAFKVVGTRDDIIALGDFMNERGIKFEKITL